MQLGILLTALSGILYGSIGYFGARLVQEGLTVSDLLFWRFSFSALLLAPITLYGLLKSKEHIDYLSLLSLFVLGILFYGAGTAMYFEASKTIGTGLAMVLFYTYPLFVVALSYFVHQLHLSKPLLVSLVLIIIGCILIAFGDHFHGNLDQMGILLATLSGVGYGFYLFFSKKFAHLVPPVLATFVVCLGSSLTFVIHTLIQSNAFYWPQSTLVWTLIGSFSLFGTVLPVLFMLIGLKYISANKASIISVLEPVTVLIVGMLILNEPVTFMQLIGAAVILSSAIIVQLDK